MGEEQERRWRGGPKIESWEEMKREGESAREDGEEERWECRRGEEGRWGVGGGRRGDGV